MIKTKFRIFVTSLFLLQTCILFYQFTSPEPIFSAFGASRYKKKDMDQLPLFGDVLRGPSSSEDQEFVEGVLRSPDCSKLSSQKSTLCSLKHVPNVVHYVWCGEKQFVFENYLSVLSALKILQPMKFVFHYNKLPITDEHWYNSWFLELKQSIPHFVLRKTSVSLKCGTSDIDNFAFHQLASRKSGGIFVGEKALVTQFPRALIELDQEAFILKYLNSSFTEHGLMFAKSGSVGKDFTDFKSKFESTSVNCVSESEYDSAVGKGDKSSVPACISLTRAWYPKDIAKATSPFASLTRWLFYGNSSKIAAVPGPENKDLIPMTSHMVFMKEQNFKGTATMPMYAFMGVLSALYVGGFHHVYVHGNREPEGYWWEQLSCENVSFVETDLAESVYQQEMTLLSHNSDILRSLVLLKHGGVYQDWDVVWNRPLPSHLRRYEAVTSYDWPKYGIFPEALNNGVMLAKPGAKFLHHFLASYRLYRGDRWGFNAMLMPYKMYERHPDTLHIDRYLQVICFHDICHPTWQDDYIRSSHDRRSTGPIDWSKAITFHFTSPDAPESMTSLHNIKNGKDNFAELGRRIFNLSGRQKMLDEA